MIPIYINNILNLVPPNITVYQACSLSNIQIPKFCFQENLKIAGNCRMCLVEIKNSPKPVASCAMPISLNMEIFTNTPLVQKARESVLEFILLNHPLDCPICDQASECDLQDQTMIYGSDRSRFFFKKRGVEDKNVGPFIKTIMTRCIHCTKCVRFADEICGDDFFGTTGRGVTTEINFYNKNIFYSEFSGNLIDLCPVGALTSKPFAFQARSWELKKKESIDILDSIGSNLNIDILKNNIIRILPKTNVNINKEWISNKTRFFFDSLKYQRITEPLFYKNNQFEIISWQKAFKILQQEILKRDGSQIQGVIGNLTDLETNFTLKKNFNQLGISNISYLYPNKKENKIDTDFTSNYLFNSSFTNIETSDLCLIINCDIRKEGSILNIHLMNRFKKGNFKIATIGSNINYTYPVKHLGLTNSTLIQILEGKHNFCKDLKKAKNPIIIFGSNFLLKNNNLIKKFKNLSFLNNQNFNILHSQSSYLNFLEINNKKFNFTKNNNNLYYLYNTDFNNININKKENFIIYQGHHFTKNAQKANLILPGLSFLEQKGYYINTEGFIQTTQTIVKKNGLQKKDFLILNYLYIYIKNLNQTKKQNIKISFQTQNYLQYLNKSKLLIINYFKSKSYFIKNLNFYFIYSLRENLFLKNILENHSRILMNSISILKNKSNYKL